MASSRTVLHAVIALWLACGLSLAAPGVDPRAATNSDAAISKQRGSGSKLLYTDGVDVVDSMHAFLATLSELESVQAGEGAREDEMIRYGLPARAKKENVGFQMPGWRRRRRRSTVEEDLMSAAYLGRLDGQAQRLVQTIHTFLADLQVVRQYYEGKKSFRESRPYRLSDSRGLGQTVDGQLPTHE